MARFVTADGGRRIINLEHVVSSLYIPRADGLSERVADGLGLADLHDNHAKMILTMDRSALEIILRGDEAESMSRILIRDCFSVGTLG